MPRGTYAEQVRRFEAIFDEYGPALTRLARAYAGDRGEQDDLFQEITMAIWRALPAYRGECSERTYVYRIAHNRAMSYLSRRRPIAGNLEDHAGIPALTPTPEQSFARSQASADLSAAVAALPSDYREVVVLMLEGLNYREIANVLGISESNVGARLTRARTQLRSLLKEEVR